VLTLRIDLRPKDTGQDDRGPGTTA